MSLQKAIQSAEELRELVYSYIPENKKRTN